MQAVMFFKETLENSSRPQTLMNPDVYFWAGASVF